MRNDFKHGPQRRNFDVRPEARDGKPEDEEKPAEEEKEEEERSDSSDEEEKKEEEENSDSDEGSSEGEEQKDEEGGSSDEDKKESTDNSRQSTACKQGKEPSHMKAAHGGGQRGSTRAAQGTDDRRPLTDDCVVEGYAATFNSPYQLFRGGGEAVYEVIDPAAFARAEMRDVILQYDHEGRVYARQSNGTLSLSLDARGLKVRADLGGTQAGRALYEEIRGGYTTRMSFAFTIEESDFEELPEERILGFSTGSTDVCYLHTIRKIGRVFDVSAVSIPANEGTVIEALSAQCQVPSSRAGQGAPAHECQAFYSDGGNDGWRARLEVEVAIAQAI